MKNTILSLLCIFLLTPSVCAVEPALADSAYNNEQYGEAISLYSQVLNEFGASTDVYYNLGNAYYRRGNLAQSILNYERALRVDPTNEDARANLAFVKARLQDKIEDGNSVFGNLHHDVVCAFTANTWAWVALISFITLCAAVALYIFSGNVLLRKLGFFGGIILIFVVIYMLVVASDARTRLNDHSEAIVTAPSTMLNSSPRQPKQTEKVVPIHEGTKVQIIDSIATPDDPVSPRYYKVRLNGSTPAWLRATDVERI